jgi:hypothetical protein
LIIEPAQAAGDGGMTRYASSVLFVPFRILFMYLLK